jgi:lysophospholipase L1-like esterase
MRWQRRVARALTAIIVVIAVCIGTIAVRAADEKPHAFESEIQKFEAHDRQSPPPEHPILFVGSSSIRFWNVANSLPDLVVLNRGFGGSHVADSVYFADRIITKYHPRAIVFYAGDNDLAAGKTSGQVFDDFKQLVAKLHGSLPKTPIVFISIKPSIARWKIVDRGREVNNQVAALAAGDPLLRFVDVGPPMLDHEGKPRTDIFMPDGLHLNAKGYEIWTALLAPILTSLK